MSIPPIKEEAESPSQLRHNTSRVLRGPAFDRHGRDTRLGVLVTIDLQFSGQRSPPIMTLSSVIKLLCS